MLPTRSVVCCLMVVRLLFCVCLACLHHASSKWVGLLDTGATQEGWEVLALDDKLLVALESQPGVKKAGAGAPGPKKFAVDKYRLLVRT